MLQLKIYRISNNEVKKLKFIDATWNENSKQINLHTALTAQAAAHCFNPLKPELNPICYLLALLGAHHFLHVSRIRVTLLTLKLLMSHIYIWSTYS